MTLKHQFLYYLLGMLFCFHIHGINAQDQLVRGSGQIQFISEAPLELIQASSSRIEGNNGYRYESVCIFCGYSVI